MTGRLTALICGAALALLPALSAQTVQPDQGDQAVQPATTEAPEGAVEVQARGPVHEAYAQPYTADPAPGPLVTKQPPAPIDELPPDQKPDGAVWVPGYWQYDDERSGFVWVSGFWRVPPPGRTWVPGHYEQVEGGWRWVPGLWQSDSQPDLTYQPPPPQPPDELGPSVPAPDDNSFWVPGCWVYVETRYLWRPGYWLGYRPGWVWQPACYEWSPAGCLFVDGYWDLSLPRRGLLFAPVCFDLARLPVDFCFVPRYCVSADVLPDALFACAPRCHYFFGDYFGRNYAAAGFTPFCDFGRGRGFVDPLFGYFRHGPRGEEWARAARGRYADRAAGRLDRPPRTLAGQFAFEGGRRGEGRSAGLVTSLDRVDRRDVALRRIDTVTRQREAVTAVRTREVARQRVEHESRLVRERAAPLRVGDQPRSVRLDTAQRADGRRADVQRPARPAEPTRPERQDLTRQPRRETAHQPAVQPQRQATQPPVRHETARQPQRQATQPSQRQATQPQRQATQPRRQATPPVRQQTTASPRQPAPQPQRPVTQQPRRQAAPPPQRQAAPQQPQRQAAPQHQAAPQRQAAPPQQPQRHVTQPPQPQRQAAPPQRQAAPPQRQAAPPQRQAAPPRPQPQRQAAPPPRQAAPQPARHNPPPPKQPAQHNPPPKQPAQQPKPKH
jgi:hypothetical protein